MLECAYCERDIVFSESVYNHDLKGRVCKECDKELKEQDK